MPYPHTYIKLTPEEKKRIEKEIERLTLLRQWKKRKPLQVLYLSDQKKTFRDIAEYLGKSFDTIRRWVYRYRKDGLEDFIRWLSRPGFGKGRSV
ncbi:MAG: helix-turn-helix domain-containing protein [Planctomycetota bacterium]